MSDQELTALLTRLTRLEDAETARNLLHAYAAALDAPTPEAVAALFTPDGVLSVPAGDFAGRAAIEGFYRERLVVSADKRHFLMNVRTRHVESGLIEVASYFVFTSREQGASGLGWGTYVDLIEVTGDRAQFRRKTITPHLATDLEHGWPADI